MSLTIPVYLCIAYCTISEIEIPPAVAVCGMCGVCDGVGCGDVIGNCLGVVGVCVGDKVVLCCNDCGDNIEPLLLLSGVFLLLLLP